MVGALLSFSVMAISIRELARAGLSIFEILAIRSGVALLVLVILLAIRPDLRAYARPQRMGLHFFRNTVHYASQFSWALSLTTLPLADFNPAAILVLLAAFGYAITMISTRKLTITESTFSIIFWMAVIQFPLSLVGSDSDAFLQFETRHILPAIGVGTAGLTSHYCLSNAFRSGDATLVVPLDFMRIPLIAVVGWAFYGERLDIFVLLGALIIVSGVLWNLRSEVARAH